MLETPNALSTNKGAGKNLKDITMDNQQETNKIGYSETVREAWKLIYEDTVHFISSVPSY
jgi:hypothetical protein